VGIGLADRIPMTETINGWPGEKSHPFQGMKRKRFCPKPPFLVICQFTQKGFKIIAI
jgi:hypothetical protein